MDSEVYMYICDRRLPNSVQADLQKEFGEDTIQFSDAIHVFNGNSVTRISIAGSDTVREAIYESISTRGYDLERYMPPDERNDLSDLPPPEFD